MCIDVIYRGNFGIEVGWFYFRGFFYEDIEGRG